MKTLNYCSTQHIKSLFAGLLLLLATIPLLAQSSEGTKFWFGFMEHNANGLNKKTAMITSRYNTSGTISVPGENWSESFSIIANEVTIVHLPTFTEVIGSETIQQLGILITTQQAVSVYIHQYFTFSSEASIVLPQGAIGSDYYVMSFQGLSEGDTDMPSEFLIIATKDNTNITITLSGYGFAESYAYTGGAGFFKNENLIPDGGCLNDTVFFDTNLPTPKYSFSWDLGDGTVTSEDKFEHIYDDLGIYPIQLIINNHCLNTTDTLKKDILISLRQAVNTLDDVVICEGESFQLGATGVEDADYEWTGPNGFFSDEQFPSFFNSSPDLSGEYSVISIVSGCESYPKSY